MAPCVPAGRRQGNCMKNDGKPRLDSRRPYGANFSLYGRIPRSALRFSWAIFGSSLRDDEPRLIEGSPKRTCSVNKNIHAIALGSPLPVLGLWKPCAMLVRGVPSAAWSHFQSASGPALPLQPFLALPGLAHFHPLRLRPVPARLGCRPGSALIPMRTPTRLWESGLAKTTNRTARPRPFSPGSSWSRTRRFLTIFSGSAFTLPGRCKRRSRPCADPSNFIPRN